MQTKVDNLGQVGLVADVEPVTLSPNAWSDLQNIRCEDRSITPFLGHEKAADISCQPETINFVKSGARNYIVYADGATIYSYSAGTETDISQYPYSTGGRWDSCVLGGVAVLNNGVQNPQYWGGEGTCLDLPYDSTDENAVCTWTDVGMTARIIRPFRYHLFAFDIDDCSGRNRRRVWWSDPADPGTLPITWDITKPDYDAGDVELSETPGAILDALSMRDTLQIYKEDAVYAATYTGRADNLIFNFRLVTSSKGIYARNCVCDVAGRHFFVSDGDIFLYDGTNFKSIADERVKNLFFDNVSRTNRRLAFCTYYHRTGEVWLFYPKAKSAHCNAALVWDSNENTWSSREIPDSDCAIFTIVDRQSDYVWGDTATPPQMVLPYTEWRDWGVAPPNPSWLTWTEPVDNDPLNDSLVLGGTNALYEVDRTNLADGQIMSCIATRTAMDLGVKDDLHQIKCIYPVAEGDPFQVEVGYQMHVNDTVDWDGPFTFDPATDYKIDVRSNGRLHAIRFSSNADVSWKISSYEIDFVQTAMR